MSKKSISIKKEEQKKRGRRRGVETFKRKTLGSILYYLLGRHDAGGSTHSHGRWGKKRRGVSKEINSENGGGKKRKKKGGGLQKASRKIVRGDPGNGFQV